MDSDSDIAGRIRKGDIKTFEQVFRSSYASLVRYAEKILRDTDAAEEIVQALFVKIWQEREKLDVTSSLSGYLYRSVHNRCLHHLDHLKIVEKYASEKRLEQPERSPDPQEIASFRELEEKVTRILGILPERCSTIFYMNRFEGYKYAEIAEKLKISIKTVEANMGKALKEFRKQLAS